MDLIETIDAWGRAHPQRIAHRSGDEVLSWGDLVARSDALAGALAEALGGDGSPVVVRGHKEPEMLVGFLGCRKAGHPYIPVDVTTPELRLASIQTIAGARLVLTPPQVAQMVAAGKAPPAFSADPSVPHYIMFTSGSTGEPKGVVITRECLDAFLGWMIREQRFQSGAEVFLNQALFSFDLSVMDTWTSLATGGSLVSVRSSDVAEFRDLFALLEGSEVTTWVSTPGFAYLCLSERRFAQAMMPGIRRFLFCGDVLPRETALELLDRFPAAEVWNTYGPTEATVATTSIRVDRELLSRYTQVPIGRPMPGTRILLEDSAGNPVSEGDRGEIVIAGPNVATGYLGRSDLTNRAFTERDGLRAYRTGDSAWQQDGLLFFGGRGDGQLKIAGHRIELGDVEAHLATLPTVRAAVVLPYYRNGHADSLHAYVVLRRPSSNSNLRTAVDLRAELALRLPTYMLPRKFHFLDQLPLTPNGKVDRTALAGRLHE